MHAEIANICLRINAKLINNIRFDTISTLIPAINVETHTRKFAKKKISDLFVANGDYILCVYLYNTLMYFLND